MLRRVPPWAWLIAPALLFVFAMAVYPLGYSFLLSLRDWKLATSDVPGRWVGLANYVDLFTQDPDFMDSLRVTAVFVASDVAATLLLALGAALLLQRQGRVYSFTRILLVLPFVMSPAVIGISFRFFFNAEYGIVQYLAGRIIPALQDLVWLSNARAAMAVVVASDV